MALVEKTLKNLGLTENEITVYLACLEEDETSPFKLSKLTGIPRTTVYDVVGSLSLKGFIELEQSDGFSKQQTKVKAKNPSTIRDVIRQKQKDLVKTEVDLIQILPLLKGEYHGKNANADFQFYPGVEGAKKVYYMEKSVDATFYTWDNLMPMDVFGMEEVDRDVDVDIEARKKGAGMMKELIALNDWSKHVLTYQCGRNPEYVSIREMRYIDNPIARINQQISVTKGQIRIVCADGEEVWGMVVTSDSLADTLISMFQVLWQIAIPITNDVIASWGENMLLKESKEKKC